MALLYVDDFENGAVGVNLNASPNSNLYSDMLVNSYSSCYIRLVSGFLSQKCCVIYHSTGNSSYVSFWKGFSFNDNRIITVGFAYSISGNISNTPSGLVPNPKCVPVEFSSSAASRLVINSDWSLTLGDLTTYPGVLNDSIFSFIEISMDFSTGNFELFVNNQFQGAGTVTFSGEKNIYFGTRSIGSGGGTYRFYDDIYILDDTGTTHNQRLGPVRAVRVPFNATTEANFTPFGAADNITAINKDSPNTSTFNRSPANNNVGDYFKLDTSVLPEDRPIIAVQQSALYRKTDIGERALKLVAKEGVDRKEHPLPDRFATFSGGPAQILETAADGSAWDLTNLAATDFGYEVTS